jgi:hypothetical protein
MSCFDEDGNAEVNMSRGDFLMMCDHINSLKKDADRYKWLLERFTGYDFFWNPEHDDDSDSGKYVAVFNVGSGFNGSKDISIAIDTAIEIEITG